MKFRFIMLVLGSTLGFGVLVFNLYHLQIAEGGLYAAKAESQYRLAGFFEPERGSIYFTDKNGNRIPAVLNKDYPVIFAVPKQISDPKATAQAIAGMLRLDEETVRRKLAKPGDAYELLATKVSDAVVEQMNSMDLEGVYVEREQFRFYPFGKLASHVLGFVGPSDRDEEIKGRYGIERAYDGYLRGKIIEGSDGRFSDRENGEDFVLTIDRNIQAQAEELIEKLAVDHRAAGGSVIVEEPATGKILALANYPTFDPNAYGESPVSSFLNPAVESIYEPGSVFKVFTMAAGIDSGSITPETTFTDTGSLTMNGRTIRNASDKVYGTVTMMQVIENSINTGAAFAARTTGRETFYRYLELFGFDEKTGLELPGEIRGQLANLGEHAREINLATASFGQGVAVTPLQLIAAVSALANHGVLMKPYLVEGDGPTVVRAVVSRETASKVTRMMISAVRKANVADIPNYTVAGKTGTAQVPDFKRGGYTDAYIHNYVGFVPASEPRFVILIKLDEPVGPPLAALTVVPAFRELAQFILNYLNIPPDDLTAPAHDTSTGVPTP